MSATLAIEESELCIYHMARRYQRSVKPTQQVMARATGTVLDRILEQLLVEFWRGLCLRCNESGVTNKHGGDENIEDHSCTLLHDYGHVYRTNHYASELIKQGSCHGCSAHQRGTRIARSNAGKILRDVINPWNGVDRVSPQSSSDSGSSPGRR